jgi:Microtubule binding
MRMRVYYTNCSEVSGFVQSALDGFKISIFSYGQSGSGKTHSMTVNINTDRHIERQQSHMLTV